VGAVTIAITAAAINEKARSQVPSGRTTSTVTVAFGWVLGDLLGDAGQFDVMTQALIERMSIDDQGGLATEVSRTWSTSSAQVVDRSCFFRAKS
jgi:hypothetical protein